jgi:hypothetical protein
VPAIEALFSLKGTYVGLTVAKIRAMDPTVKGITIIWAVKGEYCMESTVGAVTYHHNGPAHATARGRCPAAP